LIRLHVGPQGLEIAAHQQECDVLYQQPGKHARETLFFPADALADIEGKDGSVMLETIGEGKAEAHWDDAGVPRSRSFDTVKPERMPDLPVMPAHFQSLEPAFLHALVEAARTTARDGVRYALTRIQVRGRRGQLVATDGRQLLLQGGFSLPLLRARAERSPQVSEVLLSGSSCEGPAVRVACNRRFL